MFEFSIFVDQLDSALFALELQTQGDSIADVPDSDLGFSYRVRREFESPQFAAITDVNDVWGFVIFDSMAITAAWRENIVIIIDVAVQIGQIAVVDSCLGVGSIGRPPTVWWVGLPKACSMHQGSSEQEDESDEGSEKGCEGGR